LSIQIISMKKFWTSLFKEAYIPDEAMVAEYGNINEIRNHILNSVYLFSGIIGTFATYSTIIRIIKFGWQPFFIYNFLIYALVWLVYFYRHRLSINIKAIIFFLLFFALASFINYANGVISGGIVFVLISTLITLLFGWKAGVAIIILTLIVRTIIGWLYYTGKLNYAIDLSAFANSKAAMITSIMSALVIASIIVYAINEFYKWLIVSLKSATLKARELEQKNAELLVAKLKAEEHDRLKSVFLANMSHEIRTPMNAIIGFSGIISKPTLTEEKRNRYAELIQESSFDLMHIIEDILDISKIEVGQMNFMNSEFNILPLMLEILEFYKFKKRKTEKGRKINLEFQIEDEIKNLTLFHDKHRLKQILTNLLDNAFKFTHEGSIVFGCKLHESPNSLLFWVKDTGIGIRKEKHVVIFDRFRQAEDLNTTSQYGGTGLGLSIVKGIIALMNGNIWLESETNQGSTFFFTIPVSMPEKR